ncbi:hypothetical protein [Micromonospora qiuiae]|nr:hypothetical protein [Micromonospora qiuiae]
MTATPAYAHDPFSGASEPTEPYAQPVDASVPKRGCATVTTTPTAPPVDTIPAIQIIYGWHASEGNNYDAYVERIAKIVDRVDWLLDESSDYDQHINFSCRYTPNNTYGDYARALVVPLQLSIPTPTGSYGDWSAVGSALNAAGYDDAKRWYFVFTDAHVPSGTNTACMRPPAMTSGGSSCWGTAELWDSGVVGHEMLHLLGAGHAWSQETNQPYWADIMYGWTDNWMLDQDFNTNYDPSEPAASFYRDNANDPNAYAWNVARHPVLTTPVCCDVGHSGDLLTAQERTIEADDPSGTPTGFSVSGGGWFQVTPSCGNNALSCYYYDNRRSLQMNVQPHAEGKVSVTSKKAVTAGQSYKFYARLRSASAGNVKLRLSWYNASNTWLSDNDSGLFPMATDWPERTLGPVTAPAGATQVQLSVVSPAGQAFSYQLDSLQLMRCNPNCRAGM